MTISSRRRVAGIPSRRSVPRTAPRGPGWEAAKLFAGLAAGGIGALVRSSRSRPFEQATQEEPEAEMPPDPEPLPADAPAVTDQLLHLLHDSRDRWATGITATLHQWHDMAAMLAQIPDGARRVGFGGLGHLIDAAGERMATLHMVSRLSFDGSGRYRIEPALPANSPSAPSGTAGRRSSATGSGSGSSSGTSGSPARPGRRMRSRSCSTPPGCSNTACPAAPRPRSAAVAATGSGSRRTVRSRAQMFAADDVVADAELGILLRMVCHAGSTPVSRFELRDVVVGGDIRIDIPEGAPAAEGPDDDPAGPDGIRRGWPPARPASGQGRAFGVQEHLRRPLALRSLRSSARRRTGRAIGDGETPRCSRH